VGPTGPAASFGGNVVGPAAIAGTGTVTSAGTAVTGTGTTFTTQVAVGDIIIVGAQSQPVTAINSDTSLSTSAAFNPAANASNFSVQAPIATFTTSAGQPSAVMNALGDVGVGTLTPVDAFDVQGSEGVAGNLNVTGNLGVTGTVTVGMLAVSGNETVTGTLTAPVLVGPLDISGNTTATGNLTLGGTLTAATISGNTDVTGNLTVGGTIRGASWGFGGMYSTLSFLGNPGPACGSGSTVPTAQNNPITGGQSCPAGFTTSLIYSVDACDPNVGTEEIQTFMCWK
jgi:hypothetical protein